MYFQYVSGHLTPTLSSENGRSITLEEAARRSGQSVNELRSIWKAALGGIVPETDVAGGAIVGGTGLGGAAAPVTPASAAWERLPEMEQRELIRQTLYPQLPMEQFTVFEQILKARGLSLYCRHLYPELRTDSEDGKAKLVIITTIDAFRVIGDRTGRYRGQVGPEWAGDDEQWKEMWNAEVPPKYARVGIRVAGPGNTVDTVWGMARWAGYAPYTDIGGEKTLDPFWAKMAPEQLAKCAEALGFRKAFPEHLNQLYSREEMQQARTAPPTPPRDPADQRRTLDGVGIDAEQYAQAASDGVESEEEFIELMVDAGHATELARANALADFRGKYRKLWLMNKPEFYNACARDLRDMIRRRRRNVG